MAHADGLVLGSPIYFGDVTGQMRAFLERLAFPWLSYNDYSMTAAKQMPVILIEIMNGTPERNNSRYELAGFSEEAKRQWREAHWEEDLQKAFEAGKQMAV